MPEMEELIRQLAACENPYLCPHGRPIVVRMDREATGRLFKR
jgi:DNA mismatch repair protein MutL